MTTKKYWWQSKTIWAGVVGLVFGVLNAFGIAQLAGEEEGIIDAIMKVVILAASVLAIRGRLSATSEIRKAGNPTTSYTTFLLALLVLIGVGGCQERGVRLDLPFYTLVENQAINGEVQARNCWEWFWAIPDGMKPQLKPYCDSLAGMADSLFILLDEHDGIAPDAGDGGVQ